MDKNQSGELTDKIRSSIKKKLVEINAFVDNELPDYIMILVANKRSKAHMEKDLALFLGKDTTDFTNWLWDLVNNLKVNSKPKQATKVSRKEDDSSKKKDLATDEDADVLDYDLGEPEGDLYQDDENSLHSRALATECPQASEVINSASVIQQPASKESVTSKFMDYRKLSSKSEINPIQIISRIHPCSKVVPIEKRKSFEDQYDPTKPEFIGNMSSVVRVTQRNSGRPAALQPNKLLLRAVDDATKSVLDGKSISEYYRPTPITELSTSKVEKCSSRSHNLVNVKIDSRFDFNSAGKIDHEESPILSANSINSNGNSIEIGKYISSENSQNSRTIYLPTVKDIDIHNASIDSSNASQLSPLEDGTQISPHFIVTLDGIDLSTFKRKHAESSDESMEIDEDGIFLDDDDSNTAKKPKITERCKYWPACKNSDSCAYHHPTVLCKRFPECKYGDKCLYIHPNCKFDALCSRKDCPFTHASKRKFPPIPVPGRIRSTKTVCKFYPKCTVKNCAFIHPKLCRYGAKCRLPICSYSHFNIPARNQMTWKAEVS